jgi:hypothetical protein
MPRVAAGLSFQASWQVVIRIDCGADPALGPTDFHAYVPPETPRVAICAESDPEGAFATPMPTDLAVSTAA